MNHEVKKLPKNQVQIIVELSAAELKPFLEKATAQLSKETNVPGFRSGKVPYDILKDKIGEQAIWQIAAELAISKTYPDICDQEKLLTVSSPKVEIVKVAPDNPFVYKAIVPLLPQVKLGEYKKFKAKPKKVEADPAKLAATLEDLRKMRAKETLVEREAAKGDKVEVDFKILMENIPIEGGEAKKFPLIVGEGNFIPGFEEKLLGMKKDDQKKFQLTFPKDYYQKNLSDKEADFEVKMLAVYQRELPELNDQFAQSVGNKFKSLDFLKEQLAENLKQEEQTKENQKFELALMEEIISRAEFEEIPEVLIEAELDKMIAELRSEIESRQLKWDDYLGSIKKSVDDLKKEFNAKAVVRIKTALITRVVAEQEKIEVEDKEVSQEIDRTLKLYAQNEDIKKRLATPQYFTYLKNVMVSNKVFQFFHKLAAKE